MGGDEVASRGLTRIADAVRSNSAILQFAADEARSALDADIVAIIAVDASSGEAKPLAASWTAAVPDGMPPMPQHAGGWVSFQRLQKEGGAFVANAKESLDDDQGMEQRLRDLGLGSCVAAPLRLDADVLGQLLAIRLPSRDAFDLQSIAAASAVAAEVALAVAHAQQVADVERLAYTDQLTGIGNRRHFEERMAKAFSDFVRNGTVLTVAFIDVNGLHQINKELGHAEGDAVLIGVSRLVADAAADLSGASAARVGGDEFCLVVSGDDPDRVAARLEQMSAEGWRSLPHGLSVGLASSRDCGITVTAVDQLLRLADAAETRAKRAGLTVPVISGREMPKGGDGEGRSLRRLDTSIELDVVELVQACLDRFDAAPGSCAFERLRGAAVEIADRVDAVSWWINQRPGMGQTIVLKEGCLRRVPERFDPHFAAAYEGQDVYTVRDYPATARAAEGEILLADVVSGGGDPGDVSLLILEGADALVVTGGRDPYGNGWAVELHSDSRGPRPEDYAQALRVAVATALVASSPCRHEHTTVLFGREWGTHRT